eukprot:COSAG01_NODE_423_length_17260_cov_203.736962_9_plen_1246_part_00
MPFEPSCQRRQKIPGPGCPLHPGGRAGRVRASDPTPSPPPRPRAGSRGPMASLHDAAQRGDEAQAQAALQAGVNPDLRDWREYTALHWAAMRGHVAVVGALVVGGAAVGAVVGDGRTALHYAAECGHAAVVEALVGAGAGVDATDRYGHTPLSRAAYEGQTEAAAALLGAGADATRPTKQGKTAAEWAREEGHPAVAELIEGFLAAETALHVAARRGELPGLQAEVQAGVNLDQLDGLGYTAMARAAANGHATVVKALIGAGARAEQKNNAGNLPLHLALQTKAPEETVRSLLQAYSDAAAEKDSAGNLPLHFALQTKAPEETVRSLLQAYGDAAAEKDSAGSLPLHFALHTKAPEKTVRSLLQAYGDAATKEDPHGKLPLEVAMDQQLSVELFKWIADAMPQRLQTISSDRRRTFETLLLADPSPERQKFAQTYGTFRGKYKLIGDHIHSSATCLVILATELETRRLVALKLMHNKAEWLREQEMRKLTDGSLLDGRHVVPLLEVFALEEDAGTHDPRLKGEEGCSYRFGLAMLAAKRDLSDALSHSRFAGRDRSQVTAILRQIAEHLRYLHVSCGRIHGDLKPRNVILIELDLQGTGQLIWCLIDLDASCAIGEKAGQKITSSAYFPPEMARYQLETAHGRDIERIVASVQFEMWYFGLMVLQLSTCDAPPLWQSSHADNIVEDSDLHALAYQWDDLKLKKVGKLLEKAGPEWAAAADLALWCLQGDAARRPESISEVLAHKFFRPQDGKLCFLASPDELWETFVRRQAECLHRSVKAGDDEAVRKLFQSGGVHVGMPLQHAASECPVLALQRAARHGHLSLVRLLIGEVPTEPIDAAQCGMLDVRGPYGFTALHWAACYNHADVAKELIVSGCDTALLNQRGKTAWDVAIQMNSTAAVNVFARHATDDAQPHPALRAERARRGRRPAVDDAYRDDIELDHGRLVMWDTSEPFEDWDWVAEGGFGVVYKHDNVSTPIQVCIKVSAADGGEHIVARQFRCIAIKVPKSDGVDELKAEVEGLSKLGHENVVAILGMCSGPSPHSPDADTWMMCLEFCESDLEKMLYMCGTPVYENYDATTAEKLALQVATGMAFVHAQLDGHGNPMLHLDLKPENVFLARSFTDEGTTQWVAKVGDFGMQATDEATTVDEDIDSRHATSQSDSVGTFCYMSPECTSTGVTTGRYGSIGTAADVFSFGVMLWEMYSRQRPANGLIATGIPPCAVSALVAITEPSNLPLPLASGEAY